MKSHAAVSTLIAMLFVFSLPQAVSAQDKKVTQSVQGPAASSSILPSASEVMAVPVPQQRRILSYPGDAARYGMTIHPGARVVRGIFGR